MVSPGLEMGNVRHGAGTVPVRVPTRRTCVADEFRVVVVVEAGVQWLRVQGDLDVATVPELERTHRARVADGDDLVAIDLTGCLFIDSSGVRAVVQIGREIEGAGRPFAVVSPPGSASRFTLDLLGVGESLTVADAPGAVGDDRAD